MRLFMQFWWVSLSLSLSVRACACVKNRGRCTVSSSITLNLFYLFGVSRWTWSSSICLDLLASHLLGASYLYLQSAGSRCACTVPDSSCELWGYELRESCLHRKQFTGWALVFIFEIWKILSTKLNRYLMARQWWNGASALAGSISFSHCHS